MTNATTIVDRRPAVPGRQRGPVIVGLVLLLVASAMALTSDFLHTGPGIRADIKSDEAVYVMAALSAAFDHDLTYERRDLERFEGLYHGGPEGIFLKRGKVLKRVEISSDFPFVRLTRDSDPRLDRLYYGKALLYPVVAAPFVRVFGLNGLMLLNVWLMAAIVGCGYTFLAAESTPLAAMTFATAFLLVSALPVQAVFLMPEVLNVALVALAYFLFLYRDVKQDTRLSGYLSDVSAAALLGMATYSKIFPAILVAPLVALAFWRRQWTRGFVFGAAAVLVACACFGFNALVTGEFNYQGGDRKTFYGSFPFDGRRDAWNAQPTAIDDPGTAAAAVLTSTDAPARLGRNVEYFLFGRHFGFVPYFFPGAVAIAAWILSRTRRDPRRVLTFLGFAAFALTTLLVLPYTWSGGGGPVGNRYLLSAYPVLLFLVPPMQVPWAGVLAWAGGALFTAKLLLNPFIAAKYPYLMVERGAARRLPVEVTMANDLPVMLSSAPIRGRIPYGHPVMLLYFLDQNAFPPEPPGMWVSGGRRADIIVRTADAVDHLAIEAESPINTTLTVSLGGPTVTARITPGNIVKLDVPARGVRGTVRAPDSWAYLLSVSSSDGFVEALRNPSSNDMRNLGVLMRFAAVVTPR